MHDNDEQELFAELSRWIEAFIDPLTDEDAAVIQIANANSSGPVLERFQRLADLALWRVRTITFH
jgi:hypothetical protein